MPNEDILRAFHLPEQSEDLMAELRSIVRTGQVHMKIDLEDGSEREVRVFGLEHFDTKARTLLACKAEDILH